MGARTTYLNKQKKYTEEELYSELKSKSRVAFEYLYDNYSPALYGVVFNVVRNEETANDVLQDVFVKIWKNFDSYDPAKSRIYTWMLNVARNSAIDKLRSVSSLQKNEVRKDQDFILNIVASSSTYTDGIGLDKLVNSLDKEQKEVIELLYYKGFTQVEAAEELNIPLGTVKSRVRLAVNKLRKFF